MGDFVVNEFIHSDKILRILDHDKSLRSKLHARLRQELTSHRERCLEALQQCEFIDTSPISEEENLQQWKSLQSPVVPPSPRDVSRIILETLKATPLNSQTPFRPNVGSVIVPESESERKPKPGIFSGLVANGNPLSHSTDFSVPSELFLRADHILESSLAMELFGVLDKDQEDSKRITRQGVRVPFSRKRRRGLSEGFFQKDGSYHALVYGGFVHLCGGALEWPFRTCEIAFIDFFNPPSVSSNK